jgi:hypothetical protein
MTQAVWCVNAGSKAEAVSSNVRVNVRRMQETSSKIPLPSVLWKQMPLDRRRQAADALWGDANGVGEQAEAIALMAQRLKFRAKALAVLPAAKKTQYLLGLPSLPEAVAARLLVSYHMAHQRPMMAAFLDALGVAHEDGMIAEGTEIPKDTDKTRAAVKSLAASFPAEDVALYLSTLSWQDSETWGGLADLPETRGN